VQVLLTGLGDNLQVRDRLEASGDRWRLWIEVPMATKAATPDTADTPMGMDIAAAAETPAIDPASAEEPLPTWADAPVPAAEREPRRAPADPVVKPPAATGPPQMNIKPYQPDALTLALQTLRNGDYPRAIRELNALLQTRGNDVDVVRGLARAYLADGQQAFLLTWLPPRLQQWPNDSELRLLLARAQLQSGNARGAVATLEQNPPPLAQDLIYHALLAACYQQTEQWPQSVALYEQMIKQRPAQAAWQLGLAIALERLGRSATAAVHYRLAEQGQGLDNGARRFASERALALGSR
jgi:MSHA biogenesis protein MshN